MEKEMLDIVVKVLSGEACKEDKQKLITWFGRDQENLKAFSQAESIWNALEIIRTDKEYNAGNAFNQFKEKISDLESDTSKLKLRNTIDWILRIAAIVIIISGLSFLFFKPVKVISKSDSAMCEVIAPRGSKAQLLLPDGTKVWLNADSKINYRDDFNDQSREIYLEGEGYFEVAKNPDKPFIVNTSDIRIKALGTSFNVKSYAGENTIEATLMEGKVELELKSPEGNGKKLATLKPNQRATFYKISDTKEQILPVVNKSNKLQDSQLALIEKQVVIKEKIDADLAISWKNNRLYFDNESFQDLAVKLERRFGVSIHLMDNNIKEMRFSGRFDDVIIEQVLEALQFASPFYFNLNDKDIYISDKPLKDIHPKNDYN